MGGLCLARVFMKRLVPTRQENVEETDLLALLCAAQGGSEVHSGSVCRVDDGDIGYRGIFFLHKIFSNS